MVWHFTKCIDEIRILFDPPNELSAFQITPRTSPRFPETDPEDVAKLQSLLLKQMKKEEAFKVGIPYFAATLYSYSPSVSLYKIMFSSIYFQEEIDCLKRDYEQVLQKLQNAEKETARYKAELESTQENEKKLKNDLKERIKSKQQLRLVVLLVPLRCPQYSCKCLNYAN